MKSRLLRRPLVAVVALALGFMTYAGCDDIKKDIASQNPDTKQFSGTVLGKVFDKCSGAPLAGVEISMAGKSAVKTNSNGEFVFRDVPITSDASQSGNGLFWADYEVLMDFTGYNKNKADSLKYPDYRNSYVEVFFTDLNDGNNNDDGDTGGDTESGSGADTPVDGIVSSMLNLEVGSLNTTISGEIVDGPNYDPVANAIVYLKQTNNVGNTTVVKQTTTGTNGKYTFANVENGAIFTVEAMNEAKTMSGTVNVSLTCGQDKLLSSQVTAQRLVLTYTDNVRPFVTSLTPENGADVPKTSTIVITFSEPIKQNAYTRTDLPRWNNTFIDDINFYYSGLKKGNDIIPFSASWNATFDILTIAPGTLVDNAYYNVYLANALKKFTDNAGNALQDNAAITGDLEPSGFSFTTAGSIFPPATPVLTRDTIFFPTDTVDFDGGLIRLRWTVDESNIKANYFEIYRKIGDGSFDLYEYVNGIDFNDTIDNYKLVFGWDNNPRRSQSVQYMIRAISPNLVPSSFSNVITVTDRALPKLENATVDAASTTQDYIYMKFSEPMSSSGIETMTNYTVSSIGPNNARDAVYLGYGNFSSLGNGYYVRLTVNKTSFGGPGDKISVSGVTDLAGNPINPNAKEKTF
ncbi:Ig-like domain-containing protein [bacterium]|nr:Ig-like domain-containing protein [bacterium]